MLGDRADDGDLAFLDQLELPLVREQLRLAGAKHIRSRPSRVTFAEGIPLVRVGDVLEDLVVVVRKVDPLPLLVVERDEEVVREHQLADDGLDGAVELLHVPGRAGQLGDAVQRGLHLVGGVPSGLGGLELGQPPARLGELRCEAGVRCHRRLRRVIEGIRLDRRGKRGAPCARRPTPGRSRRDDGSLHQDRRLRPRPRPPGRAMRDFQLRT